MYSSRGSNAYGQSYTGQSAYGQNLGPGYSASAIGGSDVVQHSLSASRHSSMLGGSQEVDVGRYRAHPSAASQYGGQYSSVYGSAALSSAQQVPALGAKGAAPSGLESRGGYVPGVPDSPKFSSGDYVPSSSHGYGLKAGQLYAEKVADYPAIDRRQYGDRQSAYVGRDLQSELTGRYADSVGFGHEHQQSEIYDRIDQAVLIRQEQLLKAQSLQTASLEGSARQTDYLAARGAVSHHPAQDLTSYGGRMDADPRNLSMLSAASYSGQHAPSILGAAPRRNGDDLLYAQSASNPGYGVSLPPGRDYATGKGLHAKSVDLDYPGSSLSRGGHNERKDDRAGYLQEFELREEERRRERLRERDREREKEREREQLRERERERERILDRREKESERERKRALEIRPKRTPLRSSRDPRASSLAKEGRSSRRDSPHQEASHRHHSPVKEKRREYVCKVYSSSLVNVERDYSSLDNRYPRLFVSPYFAKAIVNWPKENIKLSIHTPVSFEHDSLEVENAAERKEPSDRPLAPQPAKSENRNTVWNAKMILMSGISRSALEELSSEKSLDDRIPHLCNILRFAVLKKDHSITAIGGPWESADGGDPSNDDNSLIRTAFRYAKDVTELDLQNCLHWNRFLEIHYNRIGKDGLFSHKEITVLFVPDLSGCLPSLDAWRDEWLVHKKSVAEREHKLTLKRERSRDNKEALKEETEKKKESVSSGQTDDIKKKEKEDSTDVKDAAVKKSGGNSKKLEKDRDETGEAAQDVEIKEQAEATVSQTTSIVKSGKKKIIKKVVKQKVVNKTAGDPAGKQTDKLDEKDNGEKTGTSFIQAQENESSVEPTGVKTFLRKKKVKNIPVGKNAVDEDEDIQPKVKAEKEMDSSEDKPNKMEASIIAVVQDTIVKTPMKKKIIKWVPRKKVAGEVSNSVIAGPEKDVDGNEAVVQVGDATEGTGNQTADADKIAKPVKKTGKKMIPKAKSKTPISKKQDDVVDSSKSVFKSEEDKKDKKGNGEKAASGSGVDKQKGPQDSHDGKRGKLKDGEKSKNEKDESKSKSNNEVKEKRKSEEPPRHPGLILQTKWNNDSKLRSLSLSLDSLLDYTDKDIEESTFELSLFAESLYEMLQYQMGSRILTFLQQLRIKFVMKRNQRKRQRENNHEKENVEKSQTKRLKTDELTVKNESTDLETSHTVQPEDEKPIAKDDYSIDKEVDVKMEDCSDDEDPEEDPEESDETEDGSLQHDSSGEKNEELKTSSNAEPENVAGNEKEDDSSKKESKVEAVETNSKSVVPSHEENEGKLDKVKKEITAVKEAGVDKELLQAFRFFDRNRVGYIRVEDMRLVIHSLGKFLSNRDVKELVQSALLESNTGRDDRILYNKLVRMNEV